MNHTFFNDMLVLLQIVFMLTHIETWLNLLFKVY